MRKLTTWLAVFSLAALAAFGAASVWEERRDRYLQPDRVLEVVGVEAGMFIGEIGAGGGYFTVKLARRVGPQGRIYANDISRAALDDLEKRCRDEGLGNVRTVHGGGVDPRLPKGLDMVFFVYSLHDIDRPVELLRKLHEVLDTEARLWVLDQDPAVSGDDHFLSRARVHEILAEAGYRAIGCHDFLERDLLCGFCPQATPTSVP